MNGKSTKSRLLATSIFAGVAATFLTLPGVAQDAAVSDEPVAVTDVTESVDVSLQETVTVTGSRIRQSNLTSAVPVTQFDAAQIDLSGAVNVADLLRTLPATGVSGITSTNSNFTTTASGVNTLELRNLAEDRTLVLVNGRRFVGGVPGTQIVDFNQIPTEFIERIDVITGGASAVYGSDALAGVVNIILKDDFEGITFTAQSGISDAGDNENFRGTVTAGSNFDNDRGNVATSLSWSKSNGVFFRHRDGQGVDDIDYSAFTGDIADYGTLYSELAGRPFFSSYSERGRVFAPGVGNTVFDETDGTVRPYAAAVDGFNRQAFRAAATPYDSITFATSLNYELSPYANFFTELNYSTTDTSSEFEPFPLSSEDIYGSFAYCVDDDLDTVDDRCISGAPITGAYVPADFAASIRAANPGIADEDLVYSFVRRTTEVDRRGADNTRQTARFVAGFNGQVGELPVNYEASVNWGRTTQNQESTGGIDVRNFAAALDSETLLDGTVQCVDPIARGQGCVPLNIFGAGSISPEAAAYVRADAKFDAEIEQTVFNAFLSGDSTIANFELPAGPLNWVVGYEWREESSKEIPDALSQSGLNGGNITPITIGNFSVYEFFGELEVPLAKDLPFAEELTAKFAARQSTYSTIGDTFAWSGNLEWQPVSQLRFRAQYAEAVRAPNISESFSGLSETFATVTDPCNNLTLFAGTPGFSATDSADDTRIATNCYQDPLIAARVARDGAFVLSQPELQGTGGLVGGAIAGGYDLKEEEATTATFGFIFSPDYNKWLEPLSLSVDYFKIEITDAIGTLGRNTSLNRCYGNGDTDVTSYDANSAFCSNIERYTVGPFLGTTDRVNSFSQNLSSIETSGIDLQANYAWDLEDTFEGAVGSLHFSANYQWLEKYESEAFPGAGTGESGGTLGLPEHEGLFAVVYEGGPVTLAIDTMWIGESEEDFGFMNEPVQFGNEFFTDIQARYRLLDDQLTVVAGVDNVDDNFVYAGLGLQATGHSTAPEIFDSLGRKYYVGLRFDF